MLKSLPVQLIACIILAFLIGDYLTFDITRFFFSLSCLLKDSLMFVLPVVIFSYIAAAILSLEQRAPLLIISVLLLVFLSNFVAVMLSYSVGVLALPFMRGSYAADISTLQDTIKPLFTLPFPQLISPDKAMIGGIFYGLLFSIKRIPQMTQAVQFLRESVTKLLRRTFIPLLPLYVFGFVLKMHCEGNFGMLITNYGQVFLLSAFLIITYISFLYFFAVQFSVEKFLISIKTMLPAGLTGFSTMSSAAAMPVTLAAVEETTKDKQFTQLVIPTTVNVHLLGDALGVPLLGLAVLSLSGFSLPGIEHFLIFAVYFCVAKFSTAAVPGGGVLVLLPVLQSHLGLTPEMTGLVATIYILQDSIFTASNVMGNGAFALLSHRLLKMFRLVKSAPDDLTVVVKS